MTRDERPRRRPGGRSTRVRQAVLAATIELLLETGYSGLTIEAVAARASVHKTTVYRRWTTREALVADALLGRMETRVPMPDTGALRADLVALTTAVAANLTSPEGNALLKTLVASGTHLGAVRTAGRQFWATRFALARELVRRGIARGDLPPDTDPDLVIEGLIAPLYLRLLVTGQDVDARYAERVVDLVLHGARGGGAQRTEVS